MPTPELPKRQAVKEFRASVKAIESGGCGQAIAHLKRALEIEPQFFEAHNNLGSCYMKGKQFELALASLAEAHALDAGSAVLESNLAAALLALRRHAEAEEAACRALRLDRQLAGAYYLLGLSLTAQNRFPAEALANFREACGQFPAARLPAAAILIQLGRATEAAQELRDYLRLGTPERRREVGAWLARLETSLGSTGGAYETRLPD
jgi:tetratricopeptide (TPR) repeat protein